MATSPLIPLTQQLHPSQLRSAAQRFLCPMVICISNTHINLYLCTQCLCLQWFSPQICVQKNTWWIAGGVLGEIMKICLSYTSAIPDEQCHNNSRIDEQGGEYHSPFQPMYFHDQLGGSHLKLACDGSMGSSLLIHITSIVFGTVVQHHSFT